MKHIFTIHSPLTFLVAYAVIEHLRLDREKEVILLSNKYKVPVEGFRVVPAFQDLHNTWLEKLRTLNVPISYDRYIEELTKGEEFIAYVDLMSYYQKILVTNKKCCHFHFIEEGNSAYMATDDLADLTWDDYLGGMSFRIDKYNSRTFFQSLIRVVRGYNLRLISLPYHYMAFVNFENTLFYAFSGNAFYNAPVHKKVLVTPDENNPEIFALAKEIRLKDEVIWIDGSNSRYTGLSEDYYHRAIERAIKVLQKRGELNKGRVFVKLRPGLKNVESNFLVKALKKASLSVEVLPDDMQLEALFIVSKNCCVIGVLTAALEYAHVFGHRSYSIYGLFEEQPPTFLDRMAGFWRNVEMITE